MYLSSFTSWLQFYEASWICYLRVSGVNNNIKLLTSAINRLIYNHCGFILLNKGVHTVRSRFNDTDITAIRPLIRVLLIIWGITNDANSDDHSVLQGMDGLKHLIMINVNKNANHSTCLHQ